jgi:hypothetical protein
VRWRRQAPVGERGSSPVEFAIVAGALIFLTFAIPQVGFVYFANSLALGAATQGVNVERGYQATPGSGVTHANEFLDLAGAGLTNRQVTVSRSGTEVTITVTGQAISVLPGLTFTVRKSAHGPIERPTAP